MDQLSVLLQLGVTAVVVLGSIGLVIVVDPAARLARRRQERALRRDAAQLIAEVEAFRRTTVP
jgi:hypothetical protein